MAGGPTGHPAQDVSLRKVPNVVKYASDIHDLTAIGDGLARLAANDIRQPIDKPFGDAFEKLPGLAGA